MRRALWLTLLLGCTTPTTAGPGTTGTAPTGPDPAEVEPKPFELTLTNYPGPGDTNLASRKGKVLLVDFWATWCGPCHDAATAYQKLYTAHQKDGLEVYGVDVDDDTSEVAKFLATQGVGYPILLDPSARLSGPRFRIDQIPATLVVDKQGRVRFAHQGFDDAKLAQVTAEVERLLKE